MKGATAAAYLDMSLTKFLGLVNCGRIKDACRRDGLVRWDIRDLDEYADGLHEPEATVTMQRPARAI